MTPLKTGLLILSLLIGANVMAESKTFKYSAEIKNYTATFSFNEINTNDGWSYNMTKTHSVVHSNIDGTHSVAEETKVPGIDYNGRSTITVYNKDSGDTVTLVSDTIIDDEIDGVNYNFKMTYAQDAVFVEGSWADFLNGDKVVLKLSKKGQKSFLKAFEQKLSKMIIQSLEEQFRDAGLSAKFSAKFKASMIKEGTLVLSKKEIKQNSSDYKIKGKLKIKID